MKRLNATARRPLILTLLSLSLTLSGSVNAETDKEIQEKALQARERRHMGERDHAMHQERGDQGKFRGVFYGYLPCDEPQCDGLKMTLSLNQKNRYLLVLQPAKPLNRESFEKGQYLWDGKRATLVLTPKDGAPKRELAIQDEGTLLYLNNNGKPRSGDQDRYLLKRSDVSDNREMHIH